MSSAPVLRPLGVGEILDVALAVYRRHALALWKLVAVVVALPAALDGMVARRRAAGARQLERVVGVARAAPAAVLVVSLIASFLATAAAYRLVADAYLGRAVDPGASLRFGLKRLSAR